MQFLNFQEGQFINFLAFRRIAAIISGILILAGSVSVTVQKGLKYGIDFRGGTNVQIQFTTTPNLDQLRELFAEHGMNNVVLQTFGDIADQEILLGLPIDSPLGTGEHLTTELGKILLTQHPKFEIRRIESIGPKVGDELKISAVQAILIALGLVLLYITIRFQWRQGVSAIIALVHDVLIIVGIFSILEKEFTLTVVAALLTVVGYSLNDTIVVFDRIRETRGSHLHLDEDARPDMAAIHIGGGHNDDFVIADFFDIEILGTNLHNICRSTLTPQLLGEVGRSYW